MRVLKDATMPLLPGLPPFAPVSVRLLDILSREDAVVEQVARLLRLDAACVAEVLRLADSPVFGFERQIRSLAHAVARLGAERLRALISTVGLRAGRSHRSMRGYWRHSVASGYAAAASGGAPGPPLSEVVAAACRLSAAWGLPAGSGECGLEEVLHPFPPAASEPLAVNPAHLARALEEKIAIINN